MGKARTRAASKESPSPSSHQTSSESPLSDSSWSGSLSSQEDVPAQRVAGHGARAQTSQTSGAGIDADNEAGLEGHSGDSAHARPQRVRTALKDVFAHAAYIFHAT